MKSYFSFALIVAVCALFAAVEPAFSQGTAFTYQGRLDTNGTPANGSFDMEFAVFNVPSGGAGAVVGPITRSAVGVTNGLFMLTLDFGPGLFTGTNYFLDISVRTNGGSVFNELSPRQPLTPSPYAIMANSASNLLGTLPVAQLGSGSANINITGSAASFTGNLAGDVTGTQSSTTVAKVGGVTAANVASGANLANAATALNTAATIVKRDAAGSFAATTVSLTGNLTLPNTSATFGVISNANGTLLHSFGFQNFFAGPAAGNLTMTGFFDTGIGFEALSKNTTGVNNTGVGDGALFLNTTGFENTAVGGVALAVNTTGFDNTAVGFNALGANTNGSNNVAVGSDNLQNNLAGSYNTGVGWQALLNNVLANFNVAVGEEALKSTTNGGFNVAVGAEALQQNTSGSDNTAVGNQAMFFNSNAAENVALGASALFSNTTGENNTAVGYNALSANTVSGFNTAVGWEALQNQNPSFNAFNVGVGEEALLADTTGSVNVAVGGEALLQNTTGGANTAVGNEALLDNTTGAGNIAIGSSAGQSLTTGDDNIDIGNLGNAGESSIIRIGAQGTQTKAFVAGIFGATASGGSAVFVNSAGQLGTTTSSERFKQDIHDMDDASSVLLSLRPVTFRYKPEIDPAGIPQFGLVAEEVDKADSNLVVRDEKKNIYSVRYEAVNAMLLNEFLKQHHTVEDQKAEIENLKQQNDSLAERLKNLEATVKALAERK